MSAQTRPAAVPNPTVPMLVLIAAWALGSFLMITARDWTSFWIFTGISAAGFAQQWIYFLWLLRRSR